MSLLIIRRLSTEQVTFFEKFGAEDISLREISPGFSKLFLRYFYKMENKVDADYWNDRWNNGDTVWDMGSPSTPLKEYIDTLENNELKILIPGCGNAYEAEYLFSKGFTNVYVVDYAQKALEEFSKRVPDFPKEHLLCADFFELQEQNFDLIIEQTFFCAIDPSLRKKYAEKMSELIAPAGRLVGLLFNDPKLNFESPPFGGNEAEYQTIFNPYFTFTKFEPAYNSIPPRAGRELFINFRKQ
jgi:SAM-dependent methyltransferase